MHARWRRLPTMCHQALGRVQDSDLVGMLTRVHHSLEPWHQSPLSPAEHMCQEVASTAALLPVLAHVLGRDPARHSAQQWAVRRIQDFHLQCGELGSHRHVVDDVHDPATLQKHTGM